MGNITAPVSMSNMPPYAGGTASPGLSNALSRADHVHPGQGGSSMVFLGKITAISAAVVDFSSAFSNLYDDYLMTFNATVSNSFYVAAYSGGVALPIASYFTSGWYESGGSIPVSSTVNGMGAYIHMGMSVQNKSYGDVFFSGANSDGLIISGSVAADDSVSAYNFSSTISAIVSPGVKNGFTLLPVGGSGVISGIFKLYGLAKA